ncbi:MAG: hypothetical protein M5U28_47150 [Sandaracinaceae bacterium]|nr:hypothetical protein [Sandaracinaceae bacterium]
MATAHGVYRMVGGELWLLVGRSWSLVGRHEHFRRDRGVLLFWDPRRDALFFVSQPLGYAGAPIRVQMTPGGTTSPLTLPGSFVGPLEAHEAVAQIDPRADRLWMIDRSGARYLELESLALEEAGSPVEPIHAERAVVAVPPVHWYREAIALRQRDEPAPELGISVRDGWVLAATLPISPHLPLGERGSVLLFSREVPDDFDPWTLSFTNAFEVRIVDEEFPPTAGGMLLDQTKYLEVEPIFAERVDTAFDGAAYLARGSKLGGFPTLVQGTREEIANGFVANVRCEDCEAYLRFVAQLAWPEWDLISAVIYLYACPSGTRPPRAPRTCEAGARFGCARVPMPDATLSFATNASTVGDLQRAVVRVHVHGHAAPTKGAPRPARGRRGLRTAARSPTRSTWSTARTSRPT